MHGHLTAPVITSVRQNALEIGVAALKSPWSLSIFTQHPDRFDDMSIEKKSNDEFFGGEFRAQLFEQRSYHSYEVSETLHAVQVVIVELEDVFRDAFHHLVAVDWIELSAERAACLAERVFGDGVPQAICCLCGSA